MRYRAFYTAAERVDCKLNCGMRDAGNYRWLKTASCVHSFTTSCRVDFYEFVTVNSFVTSLSIPTSDRSHNVERGLNTITKNMACLVVDWWYIHSYPHTATI